jgi:hydroxyacylglutathione hydrolase
MNDQKRKEVPALFVGFGLIVVVILYFAFRGTMTPSETGTPSVQPAAESVKLPTIPIEEAKKKFLSATAPSSSIFIDIRTAGAFAQAHIPRSVSVPLDTLPSYSPKTGSTLLLVWSVRDRTLMEQALPVLDKKGVPYAFLDGGIEAWVNTGGQAITLGNQSSFNDQSKVTLVPLDDFKGLMENADAPSVVVDVRARDLFSKSHIPKSVNIPLSELETKIADIPKGKGVALIGGTALETFQAAVRLFDLNVFVAKALNGTFDDWVAKGYPVETSK